MASRQEDGEPENDGRSSGEAEESQVTAGTVAKEKISGKGANSGTRRQRMVTEKLMLHIHM